MAIPTRLRVQVGLVDGDFVEAIADKGKIVLTPRPIVDREYTPAQRRLIDARLAESLGQVKRGETTKTFETHQEMTAFLHGEASKAQRRNKGAVKSRPR